MTEDMARKLPRYVYNERNRFGANRYYFRRGKGPRIRLPEYGSDEFDAAYNEALTDSVGEKKAKAGVNTLSWLIGQYRQSATYLALASATRKQRDNIFRQVEESAGDKPYKAITQATIVKGRDRRAGTPAQARNFLDAMRGLFGWALDSQLVTLNPAAGVKNPPRPKTQGFPIWTDAEVKAYRDRWPLGTHERVWLEVLIGTGARRGDAVIIGRQHIRDGMIGLETQKQGVWAFVPILPTMAEAIENGPTGDLTFIVGKTGRNLTKESFGNMFRVACNAAGVKKSAHGLRKYAATAFAEQGLAESELESIFGWVRGSSMAAHYSRTAERKRIARGAAEKIRNIQAPHPEDNSPHLKKVVE
ncbi:MAG: tyrosine-type recombinase/integrase [Oricola sp.]